MPIALSILALIYVFGLGLLVCSVLKFDVSNPAFSRRKTLFSLATIFMAGVWLNLACVFIVGSLHYSNLAGVILSAFGYLIWFLGKRGTLRQMLTLPRSDVILLAIIFFIMLPPTIGTPLLDWDARSVWFVQAKMIYYHGAFEQAVGWSNIDLNFMHPTYPKLIPILAAQVAQSVGYWNEYLPKISLFVLFVPAVLALVAVAEHFLSRLFGIFSIVFTAAYWLHNGYADGYVALYFACVLMGISRRFLLEDSDPGLLNLSIFAGGVLLHFKNESQVLMLCILMTLGLYVIVAKSVPRFRIHSVAVGKLGWLTIVIALLPFLYWRWIKSHWAFSETWVLSNDLVGVLTDRLSGGEAWVIVQRLFHSQMLAAVTTMVVALSLCIVTKIKIPKAFIFCLVSGVAYLTALFVVYLVSPFDLQWQLNSSVTRVTYPVTTALYLSALYLVVSLERLLQPQSHSAGA